MRNHDPNESPRPAPGNSRTSGPRLLACRLLQSEVTSCFSSFLSHSHSRRRPRIRLRPLRLMAAKAHHRRPLVYSDQRPCPCHLFRPRRKDVFGRTIFFVFGEMPPCKESRNTKCRTLETRSVTLYPLPFTLTCYPLPFVWAG